MLPNNSRNSPPAAMNAPDKMSFFEVIDAGELASRWRIPKSWILEQTRTRAIEPIPCVRLGRYVRFEWNSPALLRWWEKRRK
jgi:hypothetical protein